MIPAAQGASELQQLGEKRRAAQDRVAREKTEDGHQAAALRKVRGKRHHTRTMERLGLLRDNELGVQIDLKITPIMLLRLQAVTGNRAGTLPKLTHSQFVILCYVVELIRQKGSGGWFQMGAGKITGSARKLWCVRTFRTAISVLRGRGLLDIVDKKRGLVGGEHALRYRLGSKIRRLFVRHRQNCTPQPDREQHLKPGVGGSDSGRAARAVFVGRLAAALKPRSAGPLGEKVLDKVESTCPPEYLTVAEYLLKYAASRAGRSIRLPAVWVRQQLANALRADGVEVPPSWKVKETPEREIARLRTELEVTEEEIQAELRRRGVVPAVDAPRMGPGQAAFLEAVAAMRTEVLGQLRTGRLARLGELLADPWDSLVTEK